MTDEAEVGEGEDVINDEAAKLTERKLKIRRRAVLVSTATVFTIAAILLFISLAQIQDYQVPPSSHLTSPDLIVRRWTVRRQTRPACL